MGQPRKAEKDGRGAQVSASDLLNDPSLTGLGSKPRFGGSSFFPRLVRATARKKIQQSDQKEEFKKSMKGTRDYPGVSCKRPRDRVLPLL